MRPVENGNALLFSTPQQDLEKDTKMLQAKNRKKIAAKGKKITTNANGKSLTTNGKTQVLLYGKTPLEKEIEKLATDANQHHLESRRAMDGVLEHAAKAGEALVAMKKALGVGLSREERKVFGETKGRWSRCLDQTFGASKETARIYMRVWLKRNDPAIVNARADGIKITTLREFLDLVKPAPDPKKLKQAKLSKQQKALAYFKGPQPSDEYLYKKQVVAWVKEQLDDYFDETDAKLFCEKFDDIWDLVCKEVKLLRKQRKVKKPTQTLRLVNGKPSKKTPRSPK